MPAWRASPALLWQHRICWVCCCASAFEAPMRLVVPCINAAPHPPNLIPSPFPFPPISVNLCRMKVGLDEMYKGSVRKLQMTRSVKCDKCSGSGSKSGKRYTCEVRGSTRCAAPRCGKQHSGGGTVGRPVPAWEQFGRQRSVIERLAEPQPHAMIGIRPLPHQPRFAPCATLCRPATAAALR